MPGEPLRGWMLEGAGARLSKSKLLHPDSRDRRVFSHCATNSPTRATAATARVAARSRMQYNADQSTAIMARLGGGLLPSRAPAPRDLAVPYPKSTVITISPERLHDAATTPAIQSLGRPNPRNPFPFQCLPCSPTPPNIFFFFPSPPLQRCLPPRIFFPPFPPFPLSAMN